MRYFEQARQFLPNSSRIPESLAYVTRRLGQWDRSETYFNEAERLDPRNLNVLSQHALSYLVLRRFPEALQKLDQILIIMPDDDIHLALKAAIAQAEGDLPRASAILAPLRPNFDENRALEIQVYQAILERRPAQIIPRLKEILAKPDPELGYYNGELRFWLGWAQEVAGDHAAAQEAWRQARSELESFLKKQPENFFLLGDLALTNMGLGDKAAAFALTEQAMAAVPIEKDAMFGPIPMEILTEWRRKWGSPTGPSPPYRNYSRSHTLALSLRARSLLRCSGSIQCSIRFGTIPLSKNSAKISSRESAARGSIGKSSLTSSVKLAGVGAVCRRLIRTGERSGLSMHTATMGGDLSFAAMRS